VVKQIGNIKLYSVKDLHEALGVNARTIRDWFNKGQLKGRKIGTEWHITEENLRCFFSGEDEEKAQGAKRLHSRRSNLKASSQNEGMHQYSRQHT
jgi:predicted site-specific integrase-resolvase